jgi:hypothetical protein
VITTPAADADHFQMARSTSSTKAYSMSQYRIIIANAKYGTEMSQAMRCSAFAARQPVDSTARPRCRSFGAAVPAWLVRSPRQQGARGVETASPNDLVDLWGFTAGLRCQIRPVLRAVRSPCGASDQLRPIL